MAAIQYTVKSGDSLNAIARQYGYSDYKAAGITGFGSNPDVITPGTVLTIGGAPSGLNAANATDTPALKIPTPSPSTSSASSIVDSSYGLIPPTTQSSAAATDLSKIKAADAATLQTDQSKLASANTTQDTIRSSLADLLKNPVNTAQIIADKSAELGINTSLTQITQLINESDALRQQINQLNDEQTAQINGLNGQGRGIPQSIIDAQGAKIQKAYASRINSLSAALGAKTALASALQGNVAQAQSIVKQMVDAATYDQSQKVDAYKTLYSLNSDVISSLDSETKSILSRQYDAAQKALDDARTERTAVANLMVDAPDAGIDPLHDTLESATKKVQAVGGSISARAEARLEASGGGAPKGTITSGLLNYTPSNQAEDEKALQDSKGADGYVDPTVYLKLYNAWTSAGGLTKDFTSTFPPGKYVNPANDWLPSYLKPAANSITDSFNNL